MLRDTYLEHGAPPNARMASGESPIFQSGKSVLASTRLLLVTSALPSDPAVRGDWLWPMSLTFDLGLTPTFLSAMPLNGRCAHPAISYSSLSKGGNLG